MNLPDWDEAIWRGILPKVRALMAAKLSGEPEWMPRHANFYALWYSGDFDMYLDADDPEQPKGKATDTVRDSIRKLGLPMLMRLPGSVGVVGYMEIDRRPSGRGIGDALSEDLTASRAAK